MKQKLLLQLAKYAKDKDVKHPKREIYLTQPQLDDFIPTDNTATLGDLLLPTSRQGRRAGKIIGLAELADLPKSQFNSFLLNYPLSTDIALGAAGAFAGARLAKEIPTDSALKRFIYKAIGSSLGGFITGFGTRLYRNRKIHKIKNLIAQKGKLKSYLDDEIETPSVLNLGGKSFNYGKAQSRKFVREIALGRTPQKAQESADSYPVTKNLLEMIINYSTPSWMHLGSLVTSSVDKLQLDRLKPEEAKFVARMS